MRQNIAYYHEGETIIKSGAMEQRMYIILEGAVSISLTDGEGEYITVANLKKGDFFGEISLFYDMPRSADVKAISKVKLAYIDNKEELKQFLFNNPAFSAKMVYILAQRLAKTDQILIGKISEINRLKIAGKI